jgi:hypothetical protein
MASAPSDMVWNVVTLVRDPVRRDVSSFFQNLELMFDVWPADELRSRSAEDVAASLVELFLDTYVRSNSPREFDADPLTWFDTELKQVFGVDVFAKPFPVSRGYDRYSSANARVLLLRLEDLDRVARTAFAEFLGATVEKVVQSNDAADKVYSAVYSRFKSLLELPSEYLDRMYCSSYSKHFYSEQELAGFRSRWE